MAFGTVHTTKPSVGKNDLGYPVSPEAAGPRPSMQPTGNNAEITPEDYSGSSGILAVISVLSENSHCNFLAQPEHPLGVASG